MSKTCPTGNEVSEWFLSQVTFAFLLLVALSFEAMDPFPDWKTVVEVPVSAPRDWVKTYDLFRRLPIPDLYLAVVELEAQRPPVSERSVLTMSELKAISDRQARWVPPVCSERP